jgi:hypothetical protein
MGAAKNILGFFVKVEDDAKDPPTKAQPQQSAQSMPQFAASTGAGVPVAAQEDAAIKQQLAEALEQANQPGYDYFELAQAVQAQASFIPSEELRFQSTAAAVASLGVTPDKLLSSAQYYLSVLKKKEDEFARTLEAHTKETVTSREDEAKRFDADMQAKADQIKKLTEDINGLQAQKAAIINEIAASRTKIDQVRNNFAATMKVFVDRINSDIDKMKKYLVKPS